MFMAMLGNDVDYDNPIFSTSLCMFYHLANQLSSVSAANPQQVII